MYEPGSSPRWRGAAEGCGAGEREQRAHAASVQPSARKISGLVRERGRGELSRARLREYRAWLEGRGSAASSVNQELSALRRMFCAAAVAGFVDREKAENTRALA